MFWQQNSCIFIIILSMRDDWAYLPPSDFSVYLEYCRREQSIALHGEHAEMFTKSWLFLFQQQVSDQYILTYKQIVNLFIPVILFCIYQWWIGLWHIFLWPSLQIILNQYKRLKSRFSKYSEWKINLEIKRTVASPGTLWGPDPPTRPGTVGSPRTGTQPLESLPGAPDRQPPPTPVCPQSHGWPPVWWGRARPAPTRRSWWVTGYHWSEPHFYRLTGQRKPWETKTVKMELRLNLILVANEFRIYKLDLKTFYYKATINVSS